MLAHRLVESALRQERAALVGLLAPQLFAVELLGDAVGVQESLAFAGSSVRTRVPPSS